MCPLLEAVAFGFVVVVGGAFLGGGLGVVALGRGVNVVVEPGGFGCPPMTRVVSVEEVAGCVVCCGPGRLIALPMTRAR